MKKFVCLLMTMTLVTCLLAGCGSEKKETTAETKAETTAETTGESEAAEDHSDLKLTIYSAVFDDETHAICERFQEETGIKTDCVVLGGGEILARVQAEKDNPTASVWFGGPADPFITAKEEGLLLQYESPNAASIEAKYKDADNYWTGIYIGYVGFVSNNDRLAELNIEAPQSWEELLQDELKGEIMMASPAASSTGYVILASVLQLMGEEEGFEFMQKLNDNVLQYTERGSGCIASVISGEVAVGVCFCHDAIKNQLEGYEDLLTVTVPSEGTGYETGAMAILADGPDQEAAKIFYDWALTADCQNMFKEYGAFQFLTAEGAEAPEAAASIADAKTIEYDTVWAGENKADFTTRWAELTGN
ncbi:ABC transporter substrate-binding protein [Frisingicoccus sp.]|uniref:ABC transporter substrate-binding protein n=1 Tax=Frisingicoccus sp. TaxID=1918627 RepID=UPI003AB3BCDE